jgi:hypothetical protein
VTITDKAMILGFLLIGLAAYPGTGDDTARPDVKVSANGDQPYRLLTTGGADAGSTVIEQPDGLMVIDDSRSPPPGRRAVARIKALSDKPVKFLVYRHDDGDRGAQDDAFRQAWPDIVIVSTEEPAAETTGVIGAILTIGEDYARAGLARLDLAQSLISAWREIDGAARSVADIFDCLMRTRLTLSFAAPKKTPCHGTG